MPLSAIRVLPRLAIAFILIPHLAFGAAEAEQSTPAVETGATSNAQESSAAHAAGSLSIPGDRQIRYAVTAETLPIRDQAGKTTADVFVISYRAEGRAADDRPVTFLFNGGPGAASAFLMLGAAGPKVLVTNADGTVPRPPARLEGNPASWLAFTDLVFVDPVGTGFSRASGTGSQANKPFWNIQGDVDALSEVVRLWLTRNDRWASPKFLAGESYGAFRAVLMASALQREEGVDVNGLILVSPPLELALMEGGDYEVLPWVMHLPSMAAAAQAQGKAPPMGRDLVERFALTDYLVDLAALDSRSDTSLRADRRLAELTGLPERIIRRHEGRIPVDLFAKELLRDENRVLSLYDGSISSPDPEPDSPDLSADRMLDGIVAPYATALNAYLRSDLGYESERPYRLLNREVSRNWDWNQRHRGSRSEAGVMDALESVMALNPSMQVLVAHGVYDLVTPYFSSAWLLGRMELPDEVKANARLRVYEGGHMPYMRPAERAKLMRDVEALVETALAGA